MHHLIDSRSLRNQGICRGNDQRPVPSLAQVGEKAVRTFGTDPEFLLSKHKKIYSAIGIIQGSIDNRINISGHQFYYDNVLAECAIKPGKSKEEVVDNIRECLQLYAEMAHPYQLSMKAAHHFTRSQLNNKEARTAGCAPDTCAYLVKQIKPPKEAIENDSLRTCGGHVHLGAEILRSDGMEPVYTVYMLDLLLAIPSLWLDKEPSSKRRRALYGQAGRYRVAGPDDDPYGIEYRSLSNFWLGSPKLVSLIYDLSWLAVDWVESGFAQEMWSFDEDLYYELSGDLWKAFQCNYDTKTLQRAINDSDLHLAQPYLEMVLEKLPSDVMNSLQDSFDRKPKDLYSEWNIKVTP